MAHHPWYRLSLLWSLSQEVCTGYVVPVAGCHGSVSPVIAIRSTNGADDEQCMLPMDVLGLLASLLSHGEPLHRRHGKLRSEERNGGAISGLCSAARNRLLLVPDALLRLYCTACHWWIFRAWPYPSLDDIRFLLGYYRLLSNRVLDLERE